MYNRPFKMQQLKKAKVLMGCIEEREGALPLLFLLKLHG
jgi:hypothetical protein